MIQSIQLEIVDINQGMATITQMCWGCGNTHEIQVPLDNVGTESASGIMCDDCCVEFGV